MAKIKARKLGLFSASDVRALFGVSAVAATFALYRYARRGIIVRVKRGLYALADAVPPDLYIANQLYGPSYVSCEFALSYHRVIPETVYEITSVSTKATRRFEAIGTTYSYRGIKKSAFTGYEVMQQRGFAFRIADPEKAFVDALYYRVLEGRKPISRFTKGRVDAKKALRYAKLYGNPKLVGILKRTLSI
jgi:predicted transcriptional regulator of viral defense system